MIQCYCKDCGQPATINTLASGSKSNNYWENRSRSSCTCVDRDTNPQKRIAGQVEYVNFKVRIEDRSERDKALYENRRYR